MTKLWHGFRQTECKVAGAVQRKRAAATDATAPRTCRARAASPLAFASPRARHISEDKLRVDGYVPPSASRASRSYDIVGLGQAMLDYAAMVDEKRLQEYNVQKGGRRVITVEERAEVLHSLQSTGFEVHAGGSLANTLAVCSALSHAHELRCPPGLGGPPAPSVAMAGAVGSDPLGEFFRHEVRGAGVTWLSEAQLNVGTGTVIVLTTPDAQRSFLAYPAATAPLAPLGSRAAAAIATAGVLVVEGYLWELPGAHDMIMRAVALARAGGARIAVTAADMTVVARHKAAILEVVRCCDIVFANAGEAAALVSSELDAGASHAGGHLATERLTLALGELCGTAVVTDGSRGSCIATSGSLQVVPPCWGAHAPVDTCGAGDAYAAGFLYGLATGLPVRRAGDLAAAAASAVISHAGTELPAAAARALVDTFSSGQASDTDAEVPADAMADHQLAGRTWL